MILSVVIPAYRAEKTIRQAIQSAFSAGAGEVIVVDDGSDDSTAELSRAAGARCFVQINSGAAEARKNGAGQAAGDFLIFLDADDELVPDGVRRSVEVLQANNDLVVAAGRVIGVGGDGLERPFPIRFDPVTTQTLLVHGHGPWPPAAAVVRRSAYFEARDLDPEPLAPRFAEDYELLIRLSMTGGVDVRDDFTCRYSLAGGKSVASADSAIEAKESIRDYYAKALEIPIDLMSIRRRQMAAIARVARAHWAQGHRLRALRSMSQWLMKDPAYAISKLATSPWRRN
ncbi:glycosyl transferase family 2 [Agreia sp. Leaf244]|nr:glycosyl transferase family 2 [Agreia sp. Leaf244]